MRAGNVVKARHGVRQHRFHAAPGIHHSAVAGEIIHVKASRQIDDRGDRHGIKLAATRIERGAQPLELFYPAGGATA